MKPKTDTSTITNIHALLYSLLNSKCAAATTLPEL